MRTVSATKNELFCIIKLLEEEIETTTFLTQQLQDVCGYSKCRISNLRKEYRKTGTLKIFENHKKSPRQTAIDAGLTTYISDKGCKRCESKIKSTNSCACLNCKKEGKRPSVVNELFPFIQGKTKQQIQEIFLGAAICI